MVNLEIQDFRNLGTNILNTGITEFNDRIAFIADQVVMLHKSMGLFELCQILAELMLPY